MFKQIIALALCSCLLVACSNHINSDLFDESKFSNDGTTVHYDGEIPEGYTFVVDNFDAVANKNEDGGYDVTWNHPLNEGDHTLQIKENSKVVFVHNFNWTEPEGEKLVHATCVTNDNFIIVFNNDVSVNNVTYTINELKTRPVDFYINGDSYYCVVFDRDTISDGNNTVDITCDGVPWHCSFTIEDSKPQIFNY